MDDGNPVFLLVDDEELFRMSLREVTQARMPNAVILEAGDGQAALAILESRAVTCMVTDLAMPVLDGIALVTEMLHRAPMVPTVVVSAYADDSAAPIDGTLRTYGKPVDPFVLAEHLEQVANDAALAERSWVTLLSLLQLLASEHRSCVVRVARGSDGVDAPPRGSLTLRKGELVRATCRAGIPCVGVEAAVELLLWDDPIVTVSQDDRADALPSEADIPVPLAQIAARASTRRRHRARTSSNAPPVSRLEAPPPSEQCPLIARVVEQLLTLDGVVGAAVIDTDRGLVVGAGGTSELAVDAVVVAARDLVEGHACALQRAGAGDVRELTLTLQHQVHVLHPSRRRPGLVMYVACEREGIALPLVRMRIDRAEVVFDSAVSPGIGSRDADGDLVTSPGL